MFYRHFAFLLFFSLCQVLYGMESVTTTYRVSAHIREKLRSLFTVIDDMCADIPAEEIEDVSDEDQITSLPLDCNQKEFEILCLMVQSTWEPMPWEEWLLAIQLLDKFGIKPEKVPELEKVLLKKLKKEHAALTDEELVDLAVAAHNVSEMTRIQSILRDIKLYRLKDSGITQQLAKTISFNTIFCPHDKQGGDTRYAQCSSDGRLILCHVLPLGYARGVQAPGITEVWETNTKKRIAQWEGIGALSDDGSTVCALNLNNLEIYDVRNQEVRCVGTIDLNDYSDLKNITGCQIDKKGTTFLVYSTTHFGVFRKKENNKIELLRQEAYNREPDPSPRVDLYLKHIKALLLNAKGTEILLFSQDYDKRAARPYYTKYSLDPSQEDFIHIPSSFSLVKTFKYMRPYWQRYGDRNMILFNSFSGEYVSLSNVRLDPLEDIKDAPRRSIHSVSSDGEGGKIVLRPNCGKVTVWSEITQSSLYKVRNSYYGKHTFMVSADGKVYCSKRAYLDKGRWNSPYFSKIKAASMGYMNQVVDDLDGSSLTFLSKLSLQGFPVNMAHKTKKSSFLYLSNAVQQFLLNHTSCFNGWSPSSVWHAIRHNDAISKWDKALLTTPYVFGTTAVGCATYLGIKHCLKGDT